MFQEYFDREVKQYEKALPSLEELKRLQSYSIALFAKKAELSNLFRRTACDSSIGIKDRLFSANQYIALFGTNYDSQVAEIADAISKVSKDTRLSNEERWSALWILTKLHSQGQETALAIETLEQLWKSSIDSKHKQRVVSLTLDLCHSSVYQDTDKDHLLQLALEIEKGLAPSDLEPKTSERLVSIKSLLALKREKPKEAKLWSSKLLEIGVETKNVTTIGEATMRLVQALERLGEDDRPDSSAAREEANKIAEDFLSKETWNQKRKNLLDKVKDLPGRLPGERNAVNQRRLDVLFELAGRYAAGGSYLAAKDVLSEELVGLREKLDKALLLAGHPDTFAFSKFEVQNTIEKMSASSDFTDSDRAKVAYLFYLSASPLCHGERDLTTLLASALETYLKNPETAAFAREKILPQFLDSVIANPPSYAGRPMERLMMKVESLVSEEDNEKRRGAFQTAISIALVPLDSYTINSETRFALGAKYRLKGEKLWLGDEKSAAVNLSKWVKSLTKEQTNVAVAIVGECLSALRRTSEKKDYPLLISLLSHYASLNESVNVRNGAAAEDAYLEINKLLKKIGDNRTRIRVYYLDKLASVYSSSTLANSLGKDNPRNYAVNTRRTVVELVDQDPESTGEQKGLAYFDLAEDLRLSRKEQEAVSWYQKAEEAWSANHQPSDHNMILVPFYIAWCHLQTKNYVAAEKWFWETINRRSQRAQRLGGKEEKLQRAQIGSIRTEIGQCAESRGELERAEKLYRAALVEFDDYGGDMILRQRTLDKLLSVLGKQKKLTEFKTFIEKEVSNWTEHKNSTSLISMHAWGYQSGWGRESGTIEADFHSRVGAAAQDLLRRSLAGELVADGEKSTSDKDTIEKIRLRLKKLEPGRSENCLLRTYLTIQMIELLKDNPLRWAESFGLLSRLDDDFRNRSEADQILRGISAVRMAELLRVINVGNGNDWVERAVDTISPAAEELLSNSRQNSELAKWKDRLVCKRLIVANLLLACCLTKGDRGTSDKLTRTCINLSIRLAESIPDSASKEKVALLQEIGECAKIHSQFSLAYDAYNSAIRIAETHASPGALAMSKVGLAELAALRGDLEKSEELSRSVLSLEGVESNRAKFSAYKLMSSSAEAAGDLESALRNAKKALELAQTVTKSEVEEAPIRTRLTELYFATGNIEEAKRHLEGAGRCVGLKTISDDTSQIASVYTEFGPKITRQNVNLARAAIYKCWGIISYEESKPEKAAKCFEMANQIYEKDKSPTSGINRMLAANNVAKSRLRDFENQEAVKELMSVSADLDEVVTKIFPQLSFAEKTSFVGIANQQISELLSVCTENPDLIHRAYTYLIHWKGLLVQSLRNESIASRGAPSELANQLAQVRSKLATSSRGISGANVSTLTERKEALERQISQESKVSESSLAPGDTSSFQRRLGEHETILDFYRFIPIRKKLSHYGVVCVSKQSCDFVDLGEAKEIDRLIRNWLVAIEQGRFYSSGTGARDVRVVTTADSKHRVDESKIRQQLVSSVWGKIAKVIQPEITRLYICPEGEITKVPPQAYLDVDMSKIATSQLNSAREYLWLRENQSTPDTAQQQAIVIGDIEFRSASPLKGASRELKQIADLAKRCKKAVRILSQNEATKKNIKEKIQNARFVHIATHGYFLDQSKNSDPEDLAREKRRSAVRTFRADDVSLSVLSRNPLLNSGLLVAASESADGTSDDNLTAEELLGLDLTKCDLIALSACETALGKVRSSQGVLGLRASLMGAGARTLLMSLWKVDDDATQELMKEFYKALWSDGLSKAQSLRNAQEQVRAKKKWSHPYYWAGWILVGEP
ncbi:MAG: CHAT domain-containing protein [Cyanobacteria bacterium HKST-UBA02]|nr:CHAT domain-containing protein [Cyanobacteria bacterium HKST-UBA02]